MSLAEWAQSQHIHPQTAYRWFRQGRLPVPARRVGGLIMVGDLSGDDARSSGKTVVYARVSSADPKSDLNRQVARVTAWSSTGTASPGSAPSTSLPRSLPSTAAWWWSTMSRSTTTWWVR